MDAASLSKLNVSQIKARCKELKISGYSKLNKAALVQKLLEFGPVGASSSSSAIGPAELTPLGQTATPPPAIRLVPVQPATMILGGGTPQGEKEPGVIRNTTDMVKSVHRRRPRKGGVEGPPPKKLKKIPLASAPAEKSAAFAGFRHAIQPGQHRPTGGRIVQSDPPTLEHTAPVATHHTFQASTGSLHATDVRSSNVPTDVQSNSNASSSDACPRQMPGPASLTSDDSDPAPLLAPPKPPTAGKSGTFKPPAIVKCSHTRNRHSLDPYLRPRPLPWQTLDFPAPPSCTQFFRINMLPHPSQQRQAERMSIVLSGVSDQNVLATCVQVSRVWRYAVYRSAAHILTREFHGSRLDTIQATIKEPRVTNTWAYLRMRREEVLTRLRMFDESWLGRFFQREDLPIRRGNPVSWRMWTSPDDERQLVVALRFVSTRLVFALARQYDESLDINSWINAIVVGAEEVVRNEIWKVTTAWQGRIESFYVLFDTGEAIGHAPSPHRGHRIMQCRQVAHGHPHLEIIDESDIKERPLRADWTQYIEVVERGDAPSLQDMITSANAESYVAGISTFWLRNLTAGDQGQGELLTTIARRYVLSCVEPNSVSGRYRSVMEMTRELTGQGPVDYPVPAKCQRFGLLISEHHLVESVHLDPNRAKPGTRLHPALALVLTASGREYFVLQGTGVPIGANDEGLGELWQEIMECDEWGRVAA